MCFLFNLIDCSLIFFLITFWSFDDLCLLFAFFWLLKRDVCIFYLNYSFFHTHFYCYKVPTIHYFNPTDLMWCFNFIYIQVFYCPLISPLHPIDYIEVCWLISKYLEIFLIFFSYWFLV